MGATISVILPSGRLQRQPSGHSWHRTLLCGNKLSESLQHYVKFFELFWRPSFGRGHDPLMCPLAVGQRTDDTEAPQNPKHMCVDDKG